VAVSESARPLPQPGVFAHAAEGSIDALTLNPWISPELTDINELVKFMVKFLPDWEMVKPASAIIAKGVPQGRAANFVESA
jgi:hypothetical protein